MNNSLSVLLKKYAVPGIFIVMGLTVLIYGFANDQDAMFKMSSVFLFAAALLSFMYSSGKFKTSLINLLGFVTAIGAGITIYLSFKTVNDTQNYMIDYKITRLKAEQNLADIRFIQKRHAEIHGKYAATWDEFLAFAKVATMDYIDAVGTVPARKMTQDESRFVYNDNRPVDKSMTEEEALILSKWSNVPEDLRNFRRDTIKVNMLKTKFGSASYQDNRMINGIGRFSLDSLPYIPHTKTKWKLETKDSVGADKSPAIKVSGVLPFTKIQGSNKKEEIFFGSLTSSETSGSWE